MMSSTDQDPFLQVQADVLSQLSTTRPLFTSYLRIRSLSSSTTSPELASARSDLEVALITLADDLADLVASVRAIESDPYKYGLEIEEVSRRKRLVDDVGAEVEDMRNEILHVVEDTSSGAAGKNGNAKGKGTAYYGGKKDEEMGYAEEDDPYGEFEQQQQLRIINEQDEQLDGVFRTVGNLRQQADDMGRELEEQHEMLEEVDGMADKVGGKLATGIKKVGWVIKKNEEKASSWCIGLLILVLIILLVLLLLL